MTETDRTTTARAEDELREAGEDTARAGDRAADKVGDAASDAKDAATSAGHKLSDAVEDMIPGDSDGDGH
jgi:hypothetical protein